jgi:hypothetical protein
MSSPERDLNRNALMIVTVRDDLNAFAKQIGALLKEVCLGSIFGVDKEIFCLYGLIYDAASRSQNYQLLQRVLYEPKRSVFWCIGASPRDLNAKV